MNKFVKLVFFVFILCSMSTEFVSAQSEAHTTAETQQSSKPTKTKLQLLRIKHLLIRYALTNDIRTFQSALTLLLDLIKSESTDL